MKKAFPALLALLCACLALLVATSSSPLYVRDQLLDGYEYLFYHRAGHDARADAVSGFV